ncbi:hypothetical protein [Campylobacter fetus]|uniref:hypothetical protein n=1 Tax=Campylobacter fetus TaxID=196 RepID=UPI003AF58288
MPTFGGFALCSSLKPEPILNSMLLKISTQISEPKSPSNLPLPFCSLTTLHSLSLNFLSFKISPLLPFL